MEQSKDQQSAAKACEKENKISTGDSAAKRAEENQLPKKLPRPGKR
jgi:hypothetical protein